MNDGVLCHTLAAVTCENALINCATVQAEPVMYLEEADTQSLRSKAQNSISSPDLTRRIRAT